MKEYRITEFEQIVDENGFFVKKCENCSHEIETMNEVGRNEFSVSCLVDGKLNRTILRGFSSVCKNHRLSSTWVRIAREHLS